MASNHNLGGNYWGYLIKADKGAAPLLEQLCLGLAKIIGQLEPANAGPKNKLTPQRLAAFYKSVGGNYDSLFSTSDRGLSFMYSTLGCWHTLQPTASEYEPPAIPALTALGFVKWQTIQILLSPGAQVPLLQEAVKIYDVPRPDGGFFPKHIPREAFPDKPDEEMEKWHRDVTGRLAQESEVHRRLKNSPYPSPYNPAERVDGYFSPNGKTAVPQIRRPTRPSRTSSHDQDLAKRRSSVPDAVSPGRDGLQWANDQYGRPVDPKKRNSRSHSAHRASKSPSQRQPSNGSSQARTSTSSHRPSGDYRSTNGTFANTNGMQRRSSSRQQRDRSGAQRHPSSSTIEESSGSDGSSETSNVGQTSKRTHRRSSLWPPNLPHHKRRHSHDASYIPERKPALPPRPNGNGQHSRQRSGTLNSPPRPVSEFQPQPSPLSQRPAGSGVGNGVRFRNDIFGTSREDAVSSAPEFPPFPTSHPPYAGQARPSMYRPRTVDPPPVNPRQIMDSGPQLAPLTRESSGSSGNGNGTDRTAQRQAGGAPLRVSTVAGVGGRRYPNIEQRSAGERRAPMPV